MTTPAAWIESWRTRPSSGFAGSMISFAAASVSYAVFRSEPGLRQSAASAPGLPGSASRSVDDAVGDLEHAAGVADGGARGHRPERDDLGDTVAAVLLGDVIDHALAALDGEVDVDVGHRLAARVEEALEEVVLDRVDVGDLERVGGERAGGRARPGPTPIPFTFAKWMKSQTIRK